jgi:hypothetical protein
MYTQIGEDESRKGVKYLVWTTAIALALTGTLLYISLTRSLLVLFIPPFVLVIFSIPYSFSISRLNNRFKDYFGYGTAIILLILLIFLCLYFLSIGRGLSSNPDNAGAEVDVFMWWYSLTALAIVLFTGSYITFLKKWNYKNIICFIAGTLLLISIPIFLFLDNTII